MEGLRALVQHGAVVLDVDMADDEDAIRVLADSLIDVGVVEPGYGERCIERERTDPTGLPAAGGPIAIPHGDPSAVRRPAVAIGRPSRPVRFRQMADPDEHVDAALVFLLALPAGRKQVSALRQVALLAGDVERMRALLEARDGDAVLAALPDPEPDQEAS